MADRSGASGCGRRVSLKRRTSVGTRVSLEHLAATPVGAVVTVTAEVVHVDGRLLRFAVRAEAGDRLVATGEVTRVVVDADRFLQRATA